MSISSIKGSLPEGFDDPIALPRTPEQGLEWQEANRLWWESHPMRYDFTDRIEAKEFSREFYQEIDERFFSDVKTFMPWSAIPFDPLVDFGSLRDADVLEIGVGNGTHAQLISSFAKSYTGVDLTDYAVKSTTQRFEYLEGQGVRQGLNVRIIRMDAEHMDFPDGSFDLVWSWGVIHHSANTRRILEEIHRVLRPGGSATVMVYHRSLWNYYIFAGLFGGLLRGQLPTGGGVHKARQQLIDGAIARYYNRSEWQTLVSDLFTLEDVRIYGSKSELIPLPSGKFKNAIRSIIPNRLARLFTNKCGMGMFLVSKLTKPLPDAIGP